MLIIATLLCATQGTAADGYAHVQLIANAALTPPAWDISDVTGAADLTAARAALLDPELDAAARRRTVKRWKRLRRDVRANADRVAAALDLAGPDPGDGNTWRLTPFLDGSGVQVEGRAAEIERAARALAEFRQPTAAFRVQVSWVRISAKEAVLLARNVAEGSVIGEDLAAIRTVIGEAPEDADRGATALLTSGFDLTHEIGETKAFFAQDFDVEIRSSAAIADPEFEIFSSGAMLAVTPVIAGTEDRYRVQIGGLRPLTDDFQRLHRDPGPLVDERLAVTGPEGPAAFFLVPERLQRTQIVSGQTPGSFAVLVEVRREE